MSRKKDNSIWKKQFGIWLKRFFDEYKLDYYYFAEKYHWSASTVRYWFEGRCLPRQQGIIDIKEYLVDNITCDPQKDNKVYEEIRIFLIGQKAKVLYHKLRILYPMMNQFAGEILNICYDLAKNKYSVDVYGLNDIQPTGRTQVVVFDFDGT